MEPFIGEVRIFANNYVPDGWLLCNGATYQVNQYQALFAVIQYTWGGVQNVSFKVPNLGGLAVSGTGIPPGGGTNRVMGQIYGSATTGLTAATVPPHSHTMQRQTVAGGYASKTGTPSASVDVANLSISASATVAMMVTSGAPNTQLAPTTIGTSGGSTVVAHDNNQPYLGMLYGIAYMGDFPPPP